MISAKDGVTKIEGMRYIIKLEVLSIIASAIKGGAISKDELTEFIGEFEPDKIEELLKKYFEREVREHDPLYELGKLLEEMADKYQLNDAKENLRKAMENEWK